MALFSPSESSYLTSFLSAVDLDSSISPDGSVDPGVADRVPHLQGSEALAKATKDLMSLDVPVSSPSYHPASHQQHPNHVERGRDPAPNYWPSIGPPDAATALSSALRYGPAGVRSSSPANYLARGFSSSISPSDASRSAMLAQPGPSSGSLYTTHPVSQPHLQIAPLRGFDPSTASASSSSGFTLPPIATAGLPNGVGAQMQMQQSPSRPSPLPSSASAPSVLANTPTSASASGTTKRPLPTTLQTSADPGSAKRVRRSPSSTPFSPTAPDADPPGPKPRRSVSGASKGSPASGSGNGGGNGNAGGNGAGGGGANNKGTLLSPSQKRANHIQSEQKRRANIRRGYEALCDAVPALREAIRAEDERERAKDAEGAPDDASGGGGGKGKGRAGAGAEKGAEKGRKKKGRAEGDKPDGRAGPRSENVVLQKTIDYITGLLTEQASLKQRMDLARGMLPLGHPALPVDSRYMDPTGVPLWEREWNGGMDLDLGGDGAGDGSEDEG